MWALLLLTSCTSTLAQQSVFNLHDAPWSDENYDICLVPNKNALRPVIFEAKIEDNSAVTKKMSSKILYRSKTKTSPASLYEKVFRDGINITPNFYLEEQYIGFLNSGDKWVNEAGIPATAKADFILKIGVHADPIETISQGVRTPRQDYRVYVEQIRATMNNAPNCTYNYFGQYDKVEEITHYDFGTNNPYTCDDMSGFKQSTILNITRKEIRRVVTMPDGGIVSLKMPDGTVEVFGENYVLSKQPFTDENGDDICDWQALDQRQAK